MFDNHETAKTLWVLALIGLLAGLGKLLAGDEKITWRLVLGRGIISSILGLSSTLIWLRFPEAPAEVVLGATGLLCSVGTSTLESMIKNYLTIRK